MTKTSSPPPPTRMFAPLYLATVAFAVAEGRRSLLRGGGSTRRTMLVMDALLSDPSSSSLRRRRPRSAGSRRDQAVDGGREEDGFVRDCEAYLLSPEAAEDGIVSQSDYAGMLLSHCRLDGLCPPSPDDRDRDELTFEMLNAHLQLDFIEGACPLPPRGRFDCVLDLYGMWLDGGVFGMPAREAGVGDAVRDLCASTYPDAVVAGFARSAAPTASPSAKFVGSPRPSSVSARPSTHPSASPSEREPSRPPSSVSPRPSPIPEGSSRPSSVGSPSTLPSASPSDAPSRRPSGVGSRPSIAPSATSTTRGSGPSHHPSASSRPPAAPTLPPAAPTGGGPISAASVAGISSAVALLLAAGCVLLRAHHRRRSGPGSPTAKGPPREPNNFGIAAHEPWGGYASSLPLPYAGNCYCSSGSSSSSFRDYRFIAVFGPEGNPIPQFNPNTAGAVIIGSVTIGADSSFGSGLFAYAGSSIASSRSFFSLGTISRRQDSPANEGGASQRDDMSSLSSRRSPKWGNPNRRTMKRKRRGKSVWLDRNRLNRVRKNGPVGSPQSSSRSRASRETVPMRHRKLQTIVRRTDSDEQVSFGDWMAVSNMTEFRHPVLVTDAAAMLSQRKVFFNTLCPESIPPSECRSLPNMYHVARIGSSEAGASSLAESCFQDAQQLTESAESVSASRLVPWRKEGFSPSLQLSDSRNESTTSSEETNVLEVKKRLDLLRPAKAVFAKYKKRTNAKDWFSFKKRQYHYLRREHCIEEDSEVHSMNSYSSHVNLLPVQNASRADLPNLVLGTFAAATMPIGKQKLMVLPKLITAGNNVGIDESVAPLANIDAGNEGTQSDFLAPAETTTRARVTLHISSLDVDVRFKETDSESFNAYSRSDFSSSSPTSSAPSSSVPSSSLPSTIGGDGSASCNSSSSSSDTSQKNRQACTLAAAASPNIAVEDSVDATVDDDLKDASHLRSQSESTQEPSYNETNIVSRGSDSDDAMFSSDEENSGFLTVNHGQNPLIDASRVKIDEREAVSVLFGGGGHLVDDGSMDITAGGAKLDCPNVSWESHS